MNMVFEKTLAFTGHRPKNLIGGYDYRTPENIKMLKKLRALIIRYIEKRGVTTFISGMALGIDMWSAQIILSLKEKYSNIRLVCAIPCANQSSIWNKEDQQIYAEIISQADFVHYVSEEAYTNWCMTDRDKWMVDNSRFIISVWNGNENGGTWQTIKYAKKRQRAICCMDSNTLDINFIK